MHWDGSATFRVAFRGQFSCCHVLVGQAPLSVRFDRAAAQVDRQECLSYQKIIAGRGVTPSAWLWQYLRARSAAEEI
jgi:hypothetical protein